MDNYVHIQTYIHTYVQCAHLLFKNHIYVMHTYIHTYIHTCIHTYMNLRAQRNSIATGPLSDMLSYGIFRQREADMVTGKNIMYV